MMLNDEETTPLQYVLSDLPNSDIIELTYKPELISRRGEFTIWGCAVLVFIGWMILTLKDIRIPASVPFLWFFLVIAGLAVTLGNWMDRRTLLSLDSNCVRFTNGLRKVTLEWEDINKIFVYPSKWGKKVHVIGNTGHFFFRTLGEVKILEEVKGRMGFSEGDKILKFLLDQTSLVLLNSSEARYYYSRQ